MLSITIIILILVGASTITATIFSQAYFWQRKEYRWDRMRSLLTSEERQGPFSFWLFLGITCLFFAWLAVFEQLSFASALSFISLIGFSFHHFWRIYQRGIYRPAVTVKALLVIFFSAISLMSLIFLTYESTLLLTLQWASFIFLVPFLTAFSVGLVNLITYPQRQRIINHAHLLRRNLPTLTVVGITGSFGKTSTKYFLSQILTHAKLTHVSSRHHRNSELAIAQDMITQLSPKTKIYIAEMGAYTKGEIAALARLTQPRLGIITNIGNQHLALFGSPENLATAKWELAQELPPDGTLILNQDNPILRDKAHNFSGRIIWFSTVADAQIRAESIVSSPRQLDFTLHINNDQRHVTIPLLSQAPISNILAAVAGAMALGVNSNDIFAALSHLQPMPRTMELITKKNGQTVIDDSYSANETGVLEAIRHLATFPDKHKIIFLSPLIELGSRAHLTHELIGQALSSVDAQVYLTNSHYSVDIKHGFGTDSSSNLKIASKPTEIKAALAQIPPASVILLEGRIPELVRKSLLS